MDGGPPADPDDLAGDAWKGSCAPLAGSHLGAETLLGDVAAGLEALRGSQGLGGGPGSRRTGWPAGVGRCCRRRRSMPAGRCRFERGRPRRGMGSGGEWGITRNRPWRHGGKSRRAERRLRQLAVGHAVLQAQGKVVGAPTACVLWTSTGDPRVSCGRRLPQGDGVELGRAEQWHLPRAAADQQAGQIGGGIGSISRRCGWSSSAAYVLGTRPRRPAMKTMPGGSWWP